MPLLILRQDASNHNYSSSRFDAQGYWSAVGRFQAFLARRTLNKILRRLLRLASWEGSIPPIPARLLFAWTWPKPPAIDPTKESLAERIALENGTLTYSDACAQRGQRVDQTIAQRKRDNEQLLAAGLAPISGPLPMDPQIVAAIINDELGDNSNDATNDNQGPTMPTKTNPTRKRGSTQIARDATTNPKRQRGTTRRDRFTTREAIDNRVAMRRKVATPPSSVNASNRSIDATICTTAPVRIYDWENDEYVDEVLLPSGMKPNPAGMQLRRQHWRYDPTDVLGSVGNIRVSDDAVVATLEFSAAPDVEPIFVRVKEGHLKNVSIGGQYETQRYTQIGAGKKATIAGVNGPPRPMRRCVLSRNGPPTRFRLWFAGPTLTR